MQTYTYEQWQAEVQKRHPGATFTLETGAGETCGDEGSTTATVQPHDMQDDVVGVYVPGEMCTVWDESEEDDLCWGA